MHKIAVTINDLRRAAAASKRNVNIQRFSAKQLDQMEATMKPLIQEAHGVDAHQAETATRRVRAFIMGGGAMRQTQRGPLFQGLPATEPGAHYVKTRHMGDAVKIVPKLPDQGAYPHVRSPAAREMIGRTVHLHEAKEIEQAYKEGLKVPFLSHQGHRPWVNDIVIARTLEGPGALQAREFIEQMRQPELGLIQSSPNISDKVKAQFATGRPNRHSIKHVQKIWDADTAAYRGAPARVNLPRTQLPSGARADFAAARAAQPGLTRKQFLATQPVKTAGVYDEDAMRELGRRVRPGDVLSWEVPSADAYQEGLKSGVMTDLISGGIRKATGSPISHTALIHSIDPETGIPNIAHNYEANGGAKIESLRRYADTNVMHVARPNISEEHAREAVRRAEAAVERGVPYPKRDLALMLPGQAAKRIGQDDKAHVLNRIGSAISQLSGKNKHCDPATGVCSAFVAHALEPAFGSSEATMRALGGVGGGHLGVTPADIYNAAKDAKNSHLHEIGSYRPAQQQTGRISGLLMGAAERLKKARK